MKNLLDNLKESLVEEGLITSQELGQAEHASNDQPGDLLRTLIEKRFIKHEMLASFLGDKLHIPYVNIQTYNIDREVLNHIPEKIARRYKIIPLFEIEETVTIALANPLDLITVDDLTKLLTGYQIELVIASEENINIAIDKWYGVEETKEALIEQVAKEINELRSNSPISVDSEYKQEREKLRLEREATEPLIVKLVNNFIAQAILEGASDIHVEPKRTYILIRFRIDGLLYEKHKLSNHLISPVTSRIKIMAGMDISKKKVPQDGRIGLHIKEKNVDVRVSSLPSIYGENIVMRILDKSRGIPTLSELGLSESGLKIFQTNIKASRGLILATGPTGSGKTTSIYSLLNTLDKVEKSVVSIENPVEYEMDDLVQSQVDPKSGVTFSNALRSILRQDPDVIYLGEIRDEETADIAMRAALTGHLVISTLHTIDAPAAVSRLLDFNIPPAILGSVLNCSFAQRLVRKLCPDCKEEYKPEKRIIESIGLPHDITFFKVKGCNTCNNMGYSGRVGIYEIMNVNGVIRKLILQGASIEHIKDEIKNIGMTTLFQDGINKVAAGITTFEEVVRVTEELEL